MKECLLYQKRNNQEVQCLTCAHQCVIKEGQRGICGVRQNRTGKLYLLVYGKAIACHIDPIEKKPIYHFMPKTETLSFSTIGCNFRCANCQNWQISQIGKENMDNIDLGENLSPKQIASLALRYNCPSISYTYTEPTIYLEYALDTMKLARKEGLKNIWVSNGYMSQQTLDLICPYLDAINIDLKFYNDQLYRQYCGGSLKPVLESLKRVKKEGTWLEVTTLIIPTLSDTENGLKSIASFIKNELGAETPWHVSAFSPAISWKLKNFKATTYEQVKHAYDIGQKAGLTNIHMGNI